MDLTLSNNQAYNIELNDLFKSSFKSDIEHIICKGNDLKGFCTNYHEYSSYEYNVFRYLFDNDLPADLNIKFDLTVLPTSNKSNIIPRTRGHYHLKEGNPPKQYFDIYQVVRGQIFFQTHLPKSKIHKVYLWFAKEGDILVLPPDMCHVLYNIGEIHAILSNWCTRNDHLDYESMMETNGPAIEIIEVKEKILSLRKNIHFNDIGTIPVIISPQSNENIGMKLGFKSKHILDWAFEGKGLQIMNKPELLNNWIENFSRLQNSFSISYI